MRKEKISKLQTMTKGQMEADINFHTDISTKTGEKFIIITLSEDLERKSSFRK